MKLLLWLKNSQFLFHSSFWLCEAVFIASAPPVAGKCPMRAVYKEKTRTKIAGGSQFFTNFPQAVETAPAGGVRPPAGLNST
jgi:hypothetical protein